MKDKTDACTNNPGGTILAYYKPKPSEMSLLEKVAQRMMFIKENLSVLHKYYGSLAERDRTEDKYYLIDMEKTYLPPLQEYDANGDDLVDAGQNNDSKLLRWGGG